MMKCICSTLSLLISIICLGQQKEVHGSSTTAPYGFIEYLPDQYVEKDTLWPLIIFLHGLGESGNGNEDLVKVKAHGPGKLISNGSEFDAIVLSPQSPSWWDIGKIDEFVQWAFINYRIDSTRFYMTGLSMGGGGTWLYAVAYPDKLAAIIPICGAADPRNPEKLTNTAVWAFHNADDPVVDVSLTYQWIAGIRGAGGGPKLTIYTSGGHDAWTATYESQDVWDWLFSQELGKYQPEPLQVKLPEDTSIYPNPIGDELLIRSHKKPTTLILMDNLGRQIKVWEHNNPTNEIILLEIGSLQLNSGIYHLTVRVGNQLEVFKLIKE